MYLKYVRNEWKNSRLISDTMVAILTVSSLLLAVSLMLLANLPCAIDGMMERAETPHFLQMHTGEFDKDRLQEFAESTEYVEKYAAAEFLNISGMDIVFGNSDSETMHLGNSVQDYGLFVQMKEFDYLLSLDGTLALPEVGEIYLPVCMKKDKIAYEGMQVTICDRPFTVAGFVRDSQMNSNLASSKRLLVNEEDFQALRNCGTIEYLIEFLLTDLNRLSDFEQAYINASMPANGPTITYPLFKLMNALSDGILIAIILMVSILVTVVALLCIRFTMLTKLEEEFREIGVMKGIGLPLKSIKGLYLCKYGITVGLGCVLGFLISRCIRNFCLSGIRLYMGNIENIGWEVLLAVVGEGILFLFIMIYLNGVLQRINRVSAKEAINGEFSVARTNGRVKLPGKMMQWMGSNAFLGIGDILIRRKLYSTIGVIFILLFFLMLVPLNLYNTISDASFVTYMGVGEYDLRIDVQNTNYMEEELALICDVLSQDTSVVAYHTYRTKMLQRKTEGGDLENMTVELGCHEAFPVYYFRGHGPQSETEIALSASNADELEKELNDPLTLVIQGREKNMTVCGIYSDVTNGGKTAKAAFACDETEAMRSMVAISFSKETDVNRKAEEYANWFPFAKVSVPEEYMNQTFGSTGKSIGIASVVAVLAALVIAAFITVLFVRMLYEKDAGNLYMLHFLGYGNRELKGQYVVRILSVLVIGMAAGTVCANTIGEVAVGMVLSGMGIRSFHFAVPSLLSYVVMPILFAATVAIAAWNCNVPDRCRL